MIGDGTIGLFTGAVVLGLVHGILPDHGWPVAALYSLRQSNIWLSGLVSGFVLGFGHLFSSIAVVVAFFWAKSQLGLTEFEWMHYVAGVALIALGIREYVRGGHSHEHSDDHDHSHSHDDHSHSYDGHSHSHSPGWRARVRAAVPFAGHGQLSTPDDERGLWGIAVFAFALGFAHNEEFEIIAICAGSVHCLELMFTYATAVLAAVMAMTLLLVAGYDQYEERVEAYEDYFPAVTAAVLVLMGFGFLLGVF